MKEYLLDTNAYFNFLKTADEVRMDPQKEFEESISKLKSNKVYISNITKVEIISVLGKYARASGGCGKCERIISLKGDKCTNQFYIPIRKKWNKKKIAAWKKLIKETTNGTSHLITLDVLPFDETVVSEAQKIIEYALIYNFASMDAMIAATALQAIKNGHDMTVVTSDNSLKNCLAKCEIPVWDAFTVN